MTASWLYFYHEIVGIQIFLYHAPGRILEFLLNTSSLEKIPTTIWVSKELADLFMIHFYPGIMECIYGGLGSDRYLEPR